MSEMEWSIPLEVYEAAIVSRTNLTRDLERERAWRRALLEAACEVVTFDWSGNDHDAVDAIDRLRRSVTPPLSKDLAHE